MRRDVYQAIADPVRREIIGMLAHKSLNLNGIADNFQISRPAISKHIKILNECGVVAIEQQGRERICKIQPASLQAVSDWVAEMRALWEPRLDAFESYLQTLQSKNDGQNSEQSLGRPGLDPEKDL